MDIQGRNITVVGMGDTALALVRLLVARGARPFVTESGPGAETVLRELDALGVPFETNGHTARAFADAEIAVPSPGVPPRIAPLEALRARGVPVMGEMEFAFQFCRPRVLAVTGTNGKTTTTELVYAMAAACGETVLLAGNNATPFSAAVLVEPAPECIVLEVSSYQLETADTFRPWIGAVLNLTPDHLGRHGTMEEYARVKARLFARQSAGDAAVVNADDPWIAAMAVPAGVRRIAFSTEKRIEDGLWLDGDVLRDGTEAVAVLGDIPIPGRHNVQNVLAALAMMRAGGFPMDRVLEGLRAFRGVEHRIEHVLRAEGVDYYNDSKSTNVDSLKVALESFDRPLVLIAGGRGKGTDYLGLRDLVRRHVKALVTLGEDAARFEADLGDITPFERAEDMDDAVRRARALARPGDIVLLSPACASFDMYRNFEERGRHFKACVRGQLGGVAEEDVS